MALPDRVAARSSSRSGRPTRSTWRSSTEQIDHTPALFVIDPHGRLARLYLTQQSYAAVGQLGQLLAQEASRAAPGHPRVHSHLSYAQIHGLGPERDRRRLPRSGGGTVHARPGAPPRLYLFFATWDQQVTSLAGQLEALNAYQSAAAALGPAEAHRGRRGAASSPRRGAARLPGQTPPSPLIPGGDRPHGPAGRRLRGAGRAMVRAHIADRPDPLVLRRLDLGLAQPRAARAPVRAALSRANGGPPSTAAARPNSPDHRRRSPPCTTRPTSCSAASRHWRRGSGRSAVTRSW